MSFKPSIYQQAIFDFIQHSTGNAVVNAVAGSGKTTTIVKALELIPSTDAVYFLAFGKAIAEEIKTRVPSYVNVSTLHSLGAKALYASRKSRMDEKKVWNVIGRLKADWYQEAAIDGTRMDGDYFSRIHKLVDLYRSNLASSAKDLGVISKKHGIEIMNGEIDKAMLVLSIMMADRETHDFTDMLFIPATDATIYLPQPDWVFIDECQDLNKAQQALLIKMCGPKTRFIAVGDPHQAIFGFAGADAESFNTLKTFKNTIELPLSFNYRCGYKIIEFVNELLPHIHIQAHEGAQPGEVNQKDSFRNIQDGDMVLCRTTAPLVKMCMEFIKSHRKAYVKGGDIGKQLANIVIRSNARTLDQFEIFLKNELSVLLDRLSKKYPYMDRAELREENAYVLMEDRIIVFETIIDSAELSTPEQLIIWINELFADNKAGTCFSSVHKSKGLENERVFILEFDSMPHPMAKQSWQLEQEYNLRSCYSG